MDERVSNRKVFSKTEAGKESWLVRAHPLTGL